MLFPGWTSRLTLHQPLSVPAMVVVGSHSRVLFGAVLTAEGGPVEIGANCVVMEHAVVRGTPRHPTRIGDHVLIGPQAHLSGCVIEDDVRIATGAMLFNGARLGRRDSRVRCSRARQHCCACRGGGTDGLVCRRRPSGVRSAQ